MNPNGECKQDQRKQHSELRLENVDSFMASLAGLLDTLKTKVNVLPRVDDKGNSECPFAEDLYAERDEAEERVAEALQDASGYMELLDREIARLRGSFGRVQADANSLNSLRAKEEYQNAAQALEHHIGKNLERRKALSELIASAEKLLAFSRAKKWPVDKPQKSFRPGAVLGGDLTGVRSLGPQASKPIGSGSSATLRDSVLDSLISLGPLSKKGG